ncbi:uncharacterized protein LOC131205614 isoform X2 [Anopheles bellator]|uniref:uncharacterized protein LOC131205614 isoform X2 n=1 Tax=Anopheles bellator TaxID=139047 RepID=UPI0026470358|nr:uncharacterized protein LOC131205614 isoform X2 [Anopheles bellator]
MSSASKSKPKKSSNLRILWIPGRKKHNRKGTFNATKNGLPQNYGMQPRKNESWTLGGPLNHSKIINANFFFRDLHENNLDLAGIATATTGAMSVAAMAVKSTDLDSANHLEPMPSTSQQQQAAEEGTTSGGSPPPLIAVGTIELNNLNGDVASNKEKEIASSNQFEPLALIDEDEEREEKDRNCSNAQSSSSLLSSNNDNRSSENVHHADTLAIGEQHRRRRRRSAASKKNSAEDIDSIDQADSAVDVTHPLGERETPFDDCDEEEERPSRRNHQQAGSGHPVGVKRRNKPRNRSGSRRRQQTQTTPESVILQDEPDGEVKDNEVYEKTVTCLYWALACWDCSIS